MKYFLCFSVVAQLTILCISGSPEPDMSTECVQCQEEVQTMVETWTNETTVAEILAEMQQGCKSYPTVKQELCSKLAEIFVQIPPGLFEGMKDLAWPIPLASCALVAKCNVNCCAPNDPPEQVHLSVASNDHSIMGVSWTSLNQTASIVQYGLSPKLLTTSVSGQVSHFTSDTKYTYWNYTSSWVGTIHTARMINLKLAQTYYYRVGDGNVWSEVFEFKTFNPTQKSYSFAILGDMDFAENSDGTVASLLRLVEAGKIDAVVHSGDIR